MQELTFTATTQDETDRLGRAIARAIDNGTTVALEGTLGAGKTRLVQAIAAGCDIPTQQVTSPTYVLCQHYQGSRQIHHFDAYRLADLDEFMELGPEEYFESSGITLIEWADRVTDGLPRDRLVIRIEITGSHSRRFELLALGPKTAAALERLTVKLDEPS